MSDSALAADPRAFRVQREVGLSQLGGQSTQARPGDVAVDLGDGRTLLDVTVVNAFSDARTNPARRAGSPAVAAEDAFNRKVVKYEDLFAESGAREKFVPIAVTAHGVFDERSLRWLGGFAGVCAAARGRPSSAEYDALLQRFSVALWRGNSRMLRVGSSFESAGT